MAWYSGISDFSSDLGHFFIDPFTGGRTGGQKFSATPADISPYNNQTNSAMAGVNSTLNQQQNFYNQLLASGGLQNQSNVFGQQQALANMLQAQARGEGPNPALDQLNQTTGQNIAAQNALMAGQRGAGANAGLLARQAAQQGGMLQQNAVGQGAILRANQQLAAQQALMQQQSNMANLASQQVGQTQGGLNSMTNASLANQQALLNALAEYNRAKVGNQSNVNTVNAAMAGIGAQGQQAIFGSLLGAAGKGLAMHDGGMIPHYAEGGFNLGTGISEKLGSFKPDQVNGPASFAANYFQNYSNKQLPKDDSPSIVGGPPNPGAKQLQKGMSEFLSGAGSFIQNHANKGMVVGEQLANQGKMVPGKASVSGDSLKNDTVPAMLSPKEIILPRSVTMSADAPEQAKKFVAAILAKNGMRKK